MDNIKDIYGFVTDRIQKLTAALYRVTDLLSDKEPIKWTLRDKALNLHDDLVSVKNTKDKDGLLDTSLKNFAQIIKSLELVSVGVCVSNLNFEILKREYLFLKNFIEGKKMDIVYDSKILLDLASLGKRGKETSLMENSQLPISLEKSTLKHGLPEKNQVYPAVGGEINPQSRKGKCLIFLKTAQPKASMK